MAVGTTSPQSAASPCAGGAAHGRPFFLPWHRAYLSFFERALCDQVPDAMLAWWDWRTPTIPATFAATIFGHGGCVGTDDDHCNPKARTVDEFDLRLPHPLLPQTKVVTVTEALRRLGQVGQVTVTVVPAVPGDAAPEPTDALEFSTVRLATYRHDNRLEDDVEAEATR